jgi:cytochrome c biogenesis protein CcmG/thiol:disulfide interchange protein DsbE
VTGSAPPSPEVRPGRPGGRGAVVLLVAAGLAVLALVLLAGALLASREPPGPAAGAAPAIAPTKARAYPPGTPAPRLRLAALDGGTVDLAGLRGRPVVVNFWASWCPPCARELPLLRRTLAAHRGDRLAVVGVLVNDDPAAARAFFRRAGGSWPVGVDRGGRALAAWGVAVGLPQTFFVRPDGTLASRQLGELTPAALGRQLAAILR